MSVWLSWPTPCEILVGLDVVASPTSDFLDSELWTSSSLRTRLPEFEEISAILLPPERSRR